MKGNIKTKYYHSIQIAELLSSMVVRELSDKERKELASLIQSNDLDNEEDLEKILNQLSKPTQTKSSFEEREEMLELVKAKIAGRKKTIERRLLPYAVAAALIPLLIAVGVYFSQRIQTPAEPNIELIASTETILEYASGETLTLDRETYVPAVLEQEEAEQQRIDDTTMLAISVPLGMSHRVNLEDGTSVFLFPGSRLTFPSHFSAGQRAVTLQGEGYFDVESDASRPFRIQAGEAKVEVLGTSFNVRAYADESKVETALVEGIVNMNDTRIEPNEMASYTSGSPRISIRSLDTRIYQERASGYLVFYGKTLEEIMHDLSRWYDFDYDYTDPSLKDIHFRFKLSRDNNFKKIMEMMEMTGEVSFSISDRHVEIRNGNK